MGNEEWQQAKDRVNNRFSTEFPRLATKTDALKGLWLLTEFPTTWEHELQLLNDMVMVVLS